MFALARGDSEVTTYLELGVTRMLWIGLATIGLGLPYYVPFGLFSVEFGGENAGVVSAYLDVFAFLLAAVFQANMSAVFSLHPDSPALGWQGVWSLLAGISVLMTMLNYFFLQTLFRDAPSIETVQPRTETGSPKGKTREQAARGAYRGTGHHLRAK